MKALFITACGVAALSAAAALLPAGSPPVRRPPASTQASAPLELESRCPPGSLPDNNVCVPAARSEPTTHSASRFSVTANIPRRPERPADYAVYQLPVDIDGRSSAVSRDLESVRSSLPLGSTLELSGVTIRPQTRAAVSVVALDGQAGTSDVLYVGDLIGPTLVTRHSVPHGDQKRQYVLLFAGLRELPKLKAGASLRAGQIVGEVGAAAGALYMAVRLVRETVNPAELPIEELLREASSISVDPRNVLRMKPGVKAQ